MKNAKYILWFFVLVLLQGLVFNRILFWGYLNPYLYVILLLFLPVRIDKALLLITAFCLGICIDAFENSGGLHAAASTFIAFLRPFILRILSNRQGTEFNELKIKDLGLRTMTIYAFLLIFLHHFVLFALEAFKFSEIGTVLLRSLYSSLFTFVLVIFVHLWNVRSK